MHRQLGVAHTSIAARRSRHRILLVALGAGVTLHASVRAQEASLFAGAAHAQYADSLSGSAGTASLRLRSYRPLTAFDLQGSLSQFTTGEWAAQAAINATRFWRISGRVSLGLTASGSYADFEGGPWSGFAAAGPMVAVSGRAHLLSVGISGGGTRRIDETTLGTVASVVRGRLVPVQGLSFDLGWFGTRAGDTVAFADLTGGITWTVGPLLLAASGGMRMGDLDDDPWGQVRMEVSPHTALRIEVAVGRYPRDLTGFTDGLFLQGGVRVVLGTATPRRPSLMAPSVVVTRVNDESVRLTFGIAGNPSDVAVAGDFSAWAPIPLERGADDRWSATIAIRSGIHHYAIIADDTWILPEGVSGIDDEFGGKVGVLVVQPQ